MSIAKEMAGVVVPLPESKELEPVFFPFVVLDEKPFPYNGMMGPVDELREELEKECTI